MIAVLGGLGAALAFAGSTLCSSRSSRMLGGRSVLAWVMLVGLAATAPVVALGGSAELGAGPLAWLATGGAGNVVGLLLAYAALRIGKVGLVAPIVSTEGAIAAVISIVRGDGVAPGAGAALVVVAVGVFLAAVGRDEERAPHGGDAARALLLAGAAALCFGASLYATGRVSADLPLGWVLLPPRLVGVVAVALPLVATSRLRLTRRAVPLVVAGGLCEVAGFASFALGARHGLAISAVLTSQFAAVSAVAAFFLFGERLARVQLLGVATIVAGVALLGAVRA